MTERVRRTRNARRRTRRLRNYVAREGAQDDDRYERDDHQPTRVWPGVPSHDALPAVVEKSEVTGVFDHPAEPALVPEVGLDPARPT
jgi:hypothetical protein